jgi:hypothetical protein
MAASVTLVDVLISRLLSSTLVARCFAGTMPLIRLQCQCVDIVSAPPADFAKLIAGETERGPR